MKRLSMLVAAVGIIATAACGVNNPQPTVTITVPAPSNTISITPSITQDDAIRLLRSQRPFFVNQPDSEIKHSFTIICAGMDKESVDSIFKKYVDTGLDPGDTGALIATSAISTCPEHI